MEGASLRRELQLNSAQAKASLHNASLNKKKGRLSDKVAQDATQLEQRSASKQEEAEARRESSSLTWLQRLSSKSRDKLLRGKMAVEGELEAGRELETCLAKKQASADLRRQKQLLAVQVNIEVQSCIQPFAYSL